jgi:hypothetical protein
VRPLGPVSIATTINGRDPALDLERSCRQAAYIYGPHPTGKGAGVDNIRLVPTTRAEKRPPPLKIQLGRSNKLVALTLDDPMVYQNPTHPFLLSDLR